jgi:hypothetical protein
VQPAVKVHRVIQVLKVQPAVKVHRVILVLKVQPAVKVHRVILVLKVLHSFHRSIHFIHFAPMHRLSLIHSFIHSFIHLLYVNNK